MHELAKPNTVYLSLGPTNITTNNTEILITDIGEDAPGGLSSLTCHTDLRNCCRNSDTGGQGGRGEWYYPYGWVIQNNADSTAAGESFYRIRNAPQVIRLRRRDSSNRLSPIGFYCCVVPTTKGEMTFCASIGIHMEQGLLSSHFPCLLVCSCVLAIHSVLLTQHLILTVISCSPPPSISSGFPGTPTNTTFGGTVTYSCDPGYRLSGSATVTCEASGSWSTLPSCECEYC